MNKREQLLELYAKTSKHSNYQVLSTKLSEIISGNEIQIQTRHEPERLSYILQNIDIQNKKIADIGGNSGFFSFELIEAGAQHVAYYEGNAAHAEFVHLAAQVLSVEDKITVINQYFTFDEEKSARYNIILLLNVLHHVGDDYGKQSISLEEAKKNIIYQLNSLAPKTEMMAFQLGFNWKGNRNLCLFENGTKAELIEFIQNGIKDYWEIKQIGIAEKSGDNILYNDLNSSNIERNNSLGEFLNRPLFILQSKLVKE